MLRWWRPGALWAVVAALAACAGGDDAAPPPGQAVVELPPAGTSRIAAIERDDDLDGQPDGVRRHLFDATGRLARLVEVDIVGGVEEPTPALEVTREHDADGWLVKVTREGPALDTNASEAGYGPSRRLEQITESGPGFSTVTTLRWEGERLAGCDSAGPPPYSCAIFQDADGRVARIEYRQNAQLVRQDTFVWRPDGLLAGSSVDFVGRGIEAAALRYDADGRLAELRHTRDGVPRLWLRYLHDERGRPVTVERGELPAGFGDGTPFAVKGSYRIVWEAQPCQPVYEIQLPPSIDLGVTGMASAAGATLVCAP